MKHFSLFTIIALFLSILLLSCEYRSKKNCNNRRIEDFLIDNWTLNQKEWQGYSISYHMGNLLAQVKVNNDSERISILIMPRDTFSFKFLSCGQVYSIRSYAQRNIIIDGFDCNSLLDLQGKAKFIIDNNIERIIGSEDGSHLSIQFTDMDKLLCKGDNDFLDSDYFSTSYGNGWFTLSRD